MADDPTPTAVPPVPPAPAVAVPNPTGGDDAAALRAQLDAVRAEAEQGRAAKAELERIKAEADAAEQKRLEEQGQWKTLAEQREAQAAKLQKRILTERVRATALSEGLIDESLVSMIPADESFLTDGEPDQNKIAKAVADFKASKAHFFKTPSSGGTGSGITPTPEETTGQKFDFKKLDLNVDGGKSAVASAKGKLDSMFERAKRELRK